MKSLKIMVASVTLFAWTNFGSNAQDIDHKKMNKDIEIAEEILMSMMKQDKETVFDLAGEPKGIYVPDYGVIFNLSGAASPFRVMEHWDKDFKFDDLNIDFNLIDSFVVEAEGVQQKALILEKEARKMAEKRSDREQIIAQEAEKQAEKAERKKKWENEEEDIQVEKEVHVIVAPNGKPNPSVHRIQRMPRATEKSRVLDSASFRAVMIDFLIDYSGLIGQLKPDQKIMISSGIGGRRQFGRSYYSGKLTAEITKKDVEAYRKGKLSREQMIDKIKIDKSDEFKDAFKDLELFSTILARIYDTDLAETYYTSSRFINYNKLANYGVIYSMKVFSSVENNDKFSLPTQNLNGLSLEERNIKVEALYPQFEEELKRNILNYGRTIKSLKPNEKLLFQVKLTECKKCNMPENIELSVKQSVLMDYDAGKLSQTAALAKINVKKNIQ